MADELISKNTLKEQLRTAEGATILGNSVVRLARMDKLIGALPSVDAVEVIRCKDCKRKRSVSCEGIVLCSHRGK